MVLADDLHAAGLWAFLAHFLAEAHLRADLQLVVVVGDQAVAVEVEFAAVRGGDAAAVTVGVERAHLAVAGLLVRLDLALLVAGQVLELALHRVEGVADRDVDVGVGVVLVGLAAGDQLVARHLEVDADVEMLALLVVAVQQLDRDPAAHDAAVEAAQLLDLFPDPVLDRVRTLEVAEGDLQRQLRHMAHFDRLPG